MSNSDVMKADKITSCYIGPAISPEHFIEEHFFIYLVKGTMNGYDGHKNYSLSSGNCCLVRKNHLARYNKQKENGQFEKVVVIFDQLFLKEFQSRHGIRELTSNSSEAFFLIKQNPLIQNFIGSLAPYYSAGGRIEELFSKVKREELLLILLQANPEFTDILFDFGIPDKINLEEFMNRNYKFNVTLDRFAYLTGRSLTIFKKDFAKIFRVTPGRWLVQRRLQEAHFQINEQGLKPSEIYLDLGFEDLSHFSYAFKKQFGKSPSELTA